MYKMKKSQLQKLIKESLAEKKRPGLWANINAKKKRGEKASHGNSNAHKDAVAAGKAMKKEEAVSEELSIKKASTEQLEKILARSEDERVSPAHASQLKLIRQELKKRKESVKEAEHQGSNYKWPMSKATKDRKEADVAAQKAEREAEAKKDIKSEATDPGTEAYYDIRELIQKHARKLSDDDAYTMHELLKDFFNKAI